MTELIGIEAGLTADKKKQYSLNRENPRQAGITLRLPVVVILTFLVLLVFCLPAAHARQLAPLQGLEMLRRGFAGMRDFTAEITQEKDIALMKKRMTASGIVRFRKPDNFYMELYSPYASRLQLHDTVLTMVYPSDGVRQKIVLPPEESLKRWFVYFERPVKSLPDGVDIRATARGKQVTLDIVPRKRGVVKALRVAFHENGGLERLTIEEQNRDRTIITFRNMRKNVGLTEKDFHLE